MCGLETNRHATFRVALADHILYQGTVPIDFLNVERAKFRNAYAVIDQQPQDGFIAKRVARLARGGDRFRWE